MRSASTPCSSHAHLKARLQGSRWRSARTSPCGAARQRESVRRGAHIDANGSCIDENDHHPAQHKQHHYEQRQQQHHRQQQQQQQQQQQGLRQHHHRDWWRRGAAAACATAAAFAAAAWTPQAGAWAAAPPGQLPQQQQQQQQGASGGLEIAACRPKTSCVSTASFMSPSQYLPPWSFAPDSRETAARVLRRTLEDARATVRLEVVGDGSTVLQAELPVPGSSSDVDVVTFKLRDDGVALFSAAASGSRPDPPFCLTRGCISGPAERGRMAALRDALGWAALEADGGEDAVWVQILLH